MEGLLLVRRGITSKKGINFIETVSLGVGEWSLSDLKCVVTYVTNLDLYKFNFHLAIRKHFLPGNS